MPAPDRFTTRERSPEFAAAMARAESNGPEETKAQVWAAYNRGEIPDSSVFVQRLAQAR